MPLVGGKFFPKTRKGLKAATAYKRKLRAKAGPSRRTHRTYKILRNHIPSKYGAGKSVDAVAARKVRQRRVRAKARIRYYAEQIKMENRRRRARMNIVGKTNPTRVPSGRKMRDLNRG
jgi:hypothetical protein